MIIQKLRDFLKENHIDYLWINSTDEFLVEFNELENSSRYHVTGFSGSTGDVLLSQENIWQFVDGRYHEQADNEVDHKTTTVVKMQIGECLSDLITERITPASTIGIVTPKISLSFYNILENKLSKKNCKIINLINDPVEKFVEFNKNNEKQICKRIDVSITGLSADEKFYILSKQLKDNQTYLETKLDNIAYLTNLRQYKTPYSTTFKAKALINKKGAVIFTDEQTDNIGENFKILPLKDIDEYIKVAENILYCSSNINTADFQKIQKKAVEARFDIITIMKSIKTDAEIANFKINFERTDKVVEHIQSLVLGDIPVTEKDLSDETENQFLKQGAKQLSFSTILAAGTNSSIIHYSHPSEKVFVHDGDFVLLDCGGHFESGYSTDITRTFLRGTPNNEQKKVYTTVLKMFLNAYNAEITDTTNGNDLDKIARDIAQKANLEGFNFNHGLGHGVGINVHEHPPVISSGELGKTILQKNMVFTIEPGLYKKGFGGVRLENTVYLTEEKGKKKIKSFSHVNFQENLIDYNLLNEQEKIWLKNWQDKKC